MCSPGMLMSGVDWAEDLEYRNDEIYMFVTHRSLVTSYSFIHIQTMEDIRGQIFLYGIGGP